MMAEKKPSKKPVRKLTNKTESFREQSAKKREQSRQPRRLKKATSTAKKPVKALSRLIKAIFRPLGFLLVPFKTRPMRFIGRILGKILLLDYFKGSWEELRQVEWPDRTTTRKLTTAVIIFAIIFSIVIALVDFGLDKLYGKVLL